MFKANTYFETFAGTDGSNKFLYFTALVEGSYMKEVSSDTLCGNQGFLLTSGHPRFAGVFPR